MGITGNNLDLESKLILNTSSFKEGIAEAKGESAALTGTLESLATEGMAAFAMVSAGATAAAAAIAYVTRKAADDQVITMRLATTIEDMGRAGDTSIPALRQVAENLEYMSGINDGQILNAYNAIAKFENINTDSMDRIVKDAADMTVAIGGNLADNANNIANILETGVIPKSWGFSIALRDNVKDLVKAGDSAGALEKVLGTLEQRFGGQAQAFMDTYDGKIVRLKNDWNDFATDLGRGFVQPATDAVNALDILAFGAQRLDDVLAVHAADVYKTADSYEAYLAEMLRAQHVSRGLSDEVARQRAEIDMANDSWDVLAKWSGAVTEAEYKQAKAIEAARDAMKFAADEARGLTGAQEGLADSAGEAAQAEKDYSDALGFVMKAAKEMGDYERDLAAAEKKLADDLGKGYGNASDKILEDKAAIEDLKKAHHMALMQMMADLYQYQLAADGVLSEDDLIKLLNYEKALGLLSLDEYTAAMNALSLRDSINSLPPVTVLDIYVRTWLSTNGVNTGYEMTGAQSQMADYAAQKLRESKGGGGGNVDTRTPEEKARAGARGYQEGTPGWVTVPDGYPSDSYMVGLSSGEKFNVRPDSAPDAEMAGGIILYNYGSILFPESNQKQSLLRQLR
jgi:hypothetical protein